MNLLSGQINWNSTNHITTNEHNRFRNDILDLNVKRIHNFVFDESNIFHNDKTDVVCAIIGYISNLNEIKSKNLIDDNDDVQIIEKFFNLKGTNFIYDLEGIFSIFIWGSNNQKAYIFQDEYGSILPLYFTKSNDHFAFSTSLKEMLNQTSGERRLNHDAVLSFLYYRTMIPNELTLIENINKLIPGHYIVVDYKEHSFETFPLKMKEKRISKKLAKENLISSIGRNVENIVEVLKSKNLYTALSGGFDTNLILHYLARNTSNLITAVTIGGKRINEIPIAKECVKQYPNVQHKHKVLELNSLDFFPDIVWKLDGYVFEEGIFLQYELARILKNNGIKFIFMGECADQQFRFYRYFLSPHLMISFKQAIKKSILGDIYYKVILKKPIVYSKRIKLLKKFKKSQSKVKFYINLDWILKKNGIMLNSHNIQGLYPFLNKETKAIGRSLGLMNRKKKYYKAEVKKVLCNDISKNLNKIGGTTDVEYLIENRPDIIHKLLKSKFVKSILDTNQIAKITNNLQDYYDFILQLLYIYLFNELFITGKFDLKFNEQNLDISLDDFFKSSQ
jgi:asparagine synthetase B (glutamine-hydrolysing)